MPVTTPPSSQSGPRAGRPTVAELARELGVSWHVANRFAGELATGGAGLEGLVERIAAKVLAELGLGPGIGKDAAERGGPGLAPDGPDIHGAGRAGRAGLAVGDGVAGAADLAPPGTAATASASAPVPNTATNLTEPGGLVVAPRPYRKVAFLSDLHVPYHDERAVNASLTFLADWKPELVVVGGDLFDSYGASRFEKDPGRSEYLQDEFDKGRPVVGQIDSLGADVTYILGNHEDRLARLIRGNRCLYRLRALGDFGHVAGLPASWTIHQDGTHFRLGSLLFLHGNLRGLRTGAQHVAAWMFARLKTSCVFGHFHRVQSWVDPDYAGTLRASHAVGHLGDPRLMADYMPINNWTQGFATVDYDHDGGVFGVQQHLIVDGKLRANGRTYAG